MSMHEITDGVEITYTFRSAGTHDPVTYTLGAD